MKFVQMEIFKIAQVYIIVSMTVICFDYRSWQQ